MQEKEMFYSLWNLTVLEIIRAIHQSWSKGYRIGGTSWKELKLWTGTKILWAWTHWKNNSIGYIGHLHPFSFFSDPIILDLSFPPNLRRLSITVGYLLIWGALMVSGQCRGLHNVHLSVQSVLASLCPPYSWPTRMQVSGYRPLGRPSTKSSSIQ